MRAQTTGPQLAVMEVRRPPSCGFKLEIADVRAHGVGAPGAPLRIRGSRLGFPGNPPRF